MMIHFFLKSATANPYEVYHTHPQQDMTMMSSNITYPSSCPMELHLPPQGAACPLTKIRTCFQIHLPAMTRLWSHKLHMFMTQSKNFPKLNNYDAQHVRKMFVL